MENQSGEKGKAGRTPSLSPTDVVTLRAIIEEMPRASLDEVPRCRWRSGPAGSRWRGSRSRVFHGAAARPSQAGGERHGGAWQQRK